MSAPKVDVKSFFQDLICFLERRDDLAGFEVKQTEQVSAAVAELIEAAKNVTENRHTHSAIGSEDGGESCGICGHNWRSRVHLRAGESEQADKLRLKAALARIGSAS